MSNKKQTMEITIDEFSTINNQIVQLKTAQYEAQQHQKKLDSGNNLLVVFTLVKQKYSD